MIVNTQNKFDLAAKLMQARGGIGKKHLVAMTRLAFADEGTWLRDVGLAEDVVEAAREILETCLTPEEAEQLWAMFNHA